MLRKATPDDAGRLGEWRFDDQLELESIEPGLTNDGRTYYVADALARSVPAFAWEEGSEVLAVGGVLQSEQQPRSGLAWIVSGVTAHRSPWTFLRMALAGLHIADLSYDYLSVLSGSQLSNHHRWLERLGFVNVGQAGPETTIFRRRCS